MQNLIEMINTARDEVAPARQGKFKRHVHKVNPWITKVILNSIKFKHNLYKKCIQTPSFSKDKENIKNEMKIFSKNLCKIIRCAKIDYFNYILM